MRAQQLQRLDGPDGLEAVELPDPPEEGGSVVVDVGAAGVSFPDLLYSYGRYQDRRPPPFVPGVEVAGVVRWSPPGSHVRPGDRVAAATFVGAFAERAVARPEFTFPLPDSWDFATGAAYVMNYQTALLSLEVRGRVRAGETVLVHGAAGGLGSAAVQVTRGLGAVPLAVVSTGHKAAVAREAGAEHVVVLHEHWLAEVRELTGGRGVDAVFDVVGGDVFLDSVRSLARDGRHVVVGFAGGDIPTLKVNRLLLNNVDVVGAAWGPYVTASPEVAGQLGRRLSRMVDEGHVRPVVGSRFALDDAAAALRSLERREAVGKVVLEL